MEYLPEEIWHDSFLYPSLQASSHGRIRVLPRTGMMPNGGTRKYETKPTFGCVTTANKNALHRYFGRYIKSIGNIKVHRAVCSAFHGQPPFDGAVVIHINENGLDNRPINLKWGSQKENLNAIGHRKRISIRETKISPADAVKIRQQVADGAPQIVVADEFSISFQSVSRIVLADRVIDKLYRDNLVDAVLDDGVTA